MELYCSKCDKFTDITKHTIYKEGGELFVECEHCNHKESIN